MPAEQVKMMDLLADVEITADKGSCNTNWPDAMPSPTSYFERPADTSDTPIKTLNMLLDGQPDLLLALSANITEKGDMPTAKLIQNTQSFLAGYPDGLPVSRPKNRRLSKFVYPVY